MSSSALSSRTTRSLAKDRKATVWPSPLIAGPMLRPLAAGGEVPAGWLVRASPAEQVVLEATTAQVLRTKMLSTPFKTLVARFDAADANATSGPEPVAIRLMLGDSLKAFAGVVPSRVETSRVEGVQLVAAVHVSRT